MRDHFGTGDPAVQVRRRLPGPHPTGLYHFTARYYDPNIGCFTSPYPSGQEKNPYLCAEGDPVVRIDLQGTLSLDGIGNVLGIGTIPYEGFTGGTGAAETATAAMIADVGITALCEAGAALFTGPGADRAGLLHVHRSCCRHRPASAVQLRRENGNQMIQPGRGGQALLFGVAQLTCAAPASPAPLHLQRRTPPAGMRPCRHGAGNPGARSCQPEERAGTMSLLAAPPLLQDGQSAVIFTVAFIVIVALLLVLWRFKER
ncbi:RHS repeat domain-containing protein [[Kitasatospora] papulosa]|uniref:RHS repeat domain-containing protein n=1 Tax=[Kitasatospora] papulosa TaxID=1464011 RepID=UPI0036B1EFDC